MPKVQLYTKMIYIFGHFDTTVWLTTSQGCPTGSWTHINTRYLIQIIVYNTYNGKENKSIIGIQICERSYTKPSQRALDVSISTKRRHFDVIMKLSLRQCVSAGLVSLQAARMMFKMGHVALVTITGTDILVRVSALANYWKWVTEWVPR